MNTRDALRSKTAQQAGVDVGEVIAEAIEKKERPKWRTLLKAAFVSVVKSVLTRQTKRL